MKPFPVDATAHTQAVGLPQAVPRDQTETILVVEDEPFLRQILAEFLEASGYTTFQAKEADEALEIARRHPFPIHLLLTDVTLPEISGPQLFARLADVRPEMRVLYMSGNDGESIGAAAAFLSKPFTHDSLKQAVREVLDSARFARHGVEITDKQAV